MFSFLCDGTILCWADFPCFSKIRGLCVQGVCKVTKNSIKFWHIVIVGGNLNVLGRRVEMKDDQFVNKGRVGSNTFTAEIWLSGRNNL